MGHAWFTFQLANLTEEAVKGIIQRAVESNAYGGYMITPDRGRMPQGGEVANTVPNATYLDDEFFRLYKVTIQEGLRHGLPMDILYDELQFPTGMAGGLFYEAYPEGWQRGVQLLDQFPAFALREQRVVLGRLTVGTRSDIFARLTAAELFLHLFEFDATVLGFGANCLNTRIPREF